MTIVKQLLAKKGDQVWTVNPETPVLDVLRLLAEKHIGAVPVVAGDKVLGIFSERDYVRHAAATDHLGLETPIHQLMSSPIFFIGPQQSVDECMTLMTAKHIRHLPVLEDDRLVGMISIGDVVKQVIDEKETTIQDLEHYIVGRDYTLE
jgi:CBS domain-containing protein